MKTSLSFLFGTTFKKDCMTICSCLLFVSFYAYPSMGEVNRVSEIISVSGFEISVSGKVTSEDSGVGLPGVNVIIKGTNQGTITDDTGGFDIVVPDDNSVLVFSYVGYATQEVSVNGQSVINVVLSPDYQELAELIVVGYGSTEKKDITGSVARVTSEELRAIPAYSVEQALVGRAPGVTVQQNSGEPGGRIEVRVRGSNSMIGSNEPLYVVDGVPITGVIDYINPADIESMDILKDASATAIYGSRGANGVVIITTRKAEKGNSGRIELNSFYGVQKEINRYEMLNARDYATVANERAKNDGLTPFYDLDTVSNPGTNWQDLIFRSAPVQSHTLTFSGSSETSNYTLSTNFYQQDGLIVNTGVKRGSMRFNVDHKVNKVIGIGANVTLTRREINRLDVDNGNYGGRIYTDAMGVPPTLDGPYDSEGNYYQVDQLPDYSSFVSLDLRNPLIHTEKKDRSLHNTVLANGFIDVNILEGLKFKSLFSLEYQNSINESFNPIIYSTDLGAASDGYAFNNSFLNENILSYNKSLGTSHKIGFVGGFTAQTYMSRFESASVSGISNNITENYDLAGATIIRPPSNGLGEWTLLSWLGRANYSFKDKYLLTASVRTDGSSRFGAGNKWGTFPSAAVAWRVSEESFLQPVNLIDDLKIRASYGVTGNTALSAYQSLDRFYSVRIVQGNNTDEVGYAPGSLGNPDLKWETTTQMDVGFDLSMLEGKVELTFDYYKKNTNNLLASVPLPPSLGFGSSLKNIGEIQNKGIEVGIGSTIVFGDFKWNIMGQISANKNEVIELAGDEIFGSTNSHPFNATINIAREGEPLGVFYGLIENGLDDDGYIQYLDLDDDGSVNALDRVILGSPYPDFVYGLNNTFTYRNFELNVFFQGIQGRDVFWETAGVHLNSFQRGMNQFSDLMGNYWTEENPDPNAKYPKISSSTTQQVSDRFVKDASYLRMKLIKLAYNFPVASLTWLNRAQIYVSGTNLFTFTNYPGLDPEVNTQGSGSSDIGSRLRVGIDESSYPSAKVVSVGLNLTF